MTRGRIGFPKRRGIAAVEFAVSATLLIPLLLGIIEFSRLGMATQLITNAAREGCRVAVIPNNTAADVQNRMTAVMIATGITIPSPTVVNSDPGTAGVFLMPSNWDTAPGDTPITVTVRVPFPQVSWTTPFFLQSSSLTGTATLNSERP